ESPPTIRYLDLEGPNSAPAGIWAGPATIEQATFLGTRDAVWTSGDVALRNAIFVDVTYPLALPEVEYPPGTTPGTGSCDYCLSHLVTCPLGSDVDPGLLRFDPALNPALWDSRLRPGSAAIDAGDPTTFDADGTIADIGAYGGFDTWPEKDGDMDG